MKIASLNARRVAGTKDVQYLAQIARSMQIDVILLQSTNWAATQREGEYTYYSGQHAGLLYKTALDLDIHIDQTERIVIAHTNQLNLISAYCPFSDQNAQRAFWDDLNQRTARMPLPDTIIMGDFNAHISIVDLQQHEQCIRTTSDNESYPATSDSNGKDLLQFTLNHHLKIHNFENVVPFTQRITCRNTAPNGGTIIDYAMSNLTNHYCSGISVKRLRYNTDHNALITTIHPKQQPTHHRPGHETNNIPNPTGPPAYKKARIEIERIKKPRQKQTRQSYLSKNTRRLNRQLHNTTDPRERETIRKLTQKSQRADWERHLRNIGAQIQAHAEQNELREAYLLLRPWTRPRTKRTPPSTASLARLTHKLATILTRTITGPTIDAAIHTRPQHEANPQKVTAYTDGSWDRRNAMGWASLVTAGPTQGQAHINGTTDLNQASATRAEALAILQVIQAHRGADITIHTDSKNCVDAMRTLRRAIASEFATAKNRDVWKQIAREIGQHQTNVTLIKIPGHTGILPNEICDRLAKYGRSNQHPLTTHIGDITITALTDHYLREHSTPGADITWEDTPITPLPLLDDIPTDQEIETALKQLHNHKAAGLDGITAEHLKTPELLPTLIAAIKEIWATQQIPEEWQQTKMVALPKPDNGVRGIALTSTFSKVLTRIILNRYADTVVGAEQFAFRPAKNTTQAIIALQKALHTRYAQQTAAYALFVDITKAYDSVSRNSLDSVLTAYGVGPTARALISNLYEDEIWVHDAGRTLPNSGFRSTCGVKQGCILSPWIFILFMDIIIRNTKQHNPEAFILLYADDIAIATDTLPQMQQVATALETELARFGLHINMTKTELMPQESTDTRDSLVGYESRLQKIGIDPELDGMPTALPRCRRGQRATEILIPSTPGTLLCPLRDCGFKARPNLATTPPTLLLKHAKRAHPKHVSNRATIVKLPAITPNTAPTENRRILRQTESGQTITLREGPVKLCKEYRYLGRWLTSDDSDTLDITNRINAASRALWALKHVWQAKNIRRWLKAQLLKTLVFPILFYGSGTWAPTETDITRLRSFYHLAARKAGAFKGILTPEGWRKTSATTVRQHMRIPTITDALREERMRLFGQLIRLDNSITATAARACTGHHRRAHMRPCWWTQVHEDMHRLNISTNDAHRKKWHVITKAPRPGTEQQVNTATTEEDSNQSEDVAPQT